MERNHPSAEAYWIWPGNAFYLQNCYAGFRHDFEMESLPSSAPLLITADQSYRLYVNGRYVCRGPVRGYQNSWPFDEVEILPFLKSGHNWISVEAYNPGISTFAYNHADRAGFLCSGNWDNGTKILSRTCDWTIFRNTAYAHDTARLSYQMGWQEEVDLRYDDRKWITEEKNYTVPPQPEWCGPQQSIQGSLPWTGLEHRRIPLLEERKLAPPTVVSAGTGPCSAPLPESPFREHNFVWDFALHELPQCTECAPPPFRREENAVCCEIPASGTGHWQCVTFDLGAEEWLPGTPVLEYENGEPGTIVDLLYFHWLPEHRIRFAPAPGEGSHVALGTRIHLGASGGIYECYQIMGVRHVTVIVRETVKPLKLKLSWRSAVYPVKISGNFHCSDSVLNDIYRISVHTQRVCSMDAFVDTPWREQSQWWGDARVQAKNLHFLSADSRMLTQGIRSIAGQSAPDGLTFADAPTTDSGCLLPDFCLTWITTLYDLWFQTGSNAVFLEQKSRAESIFAYFEQTRDPHGLLAADPRYWLFEDWSELPKDNIPAFLNLWHLYTQRLYCKLLNVSGFDREAGILERKMEEERSRIEAAFFDAEQGLIMPELDRDGKRRGIPSVHDQVLALLLGLCPQASETMIRKRILPCLNGTLQNCAQPSPFWATYLLDAAQMLGLRAEALNYIRVNWSPMIPTGTVWENFPRGDYSGWSYSHAWSAHVISHLPELVFGLKQTGPAWKEVEFAPLALLDHARMTVPTPQGMIRGELERNGEFAEASIVIPEGIHAVLRLPGETIRTNGAAATVTKRIPAGL